MIAKKTQENHWEIIEGSKTWMIRHDPDDNTATVDCYYNSESVGYVEISGGDGDAAEKAIQHTVFHACDNEAMDQRFDLHAASMILGLSPGGLFSVTLARTGQSR